MDKGERLYTALKTLVEISRETQQEVLSRNSGYGIKSWAKDFCTIHAGTSRGSGHDYALTRFLANDVNGAIVLFQNQQLKNIFRREYVNHTLKDPKYNSIYLCSLNSRDYFGISNIDTVVICHSFLLGRKGRDKIYNNFIPTLDRTKPFFFIFLQ